MSPVSVWPAMVATALALCVALLLARWFGQEPGAGRFASLDGLRGYLAFFVFLHHSAISYFRNHSSEPEGGLPRIYSHFGESSVALFFMITAFLFFSKLIDGRTRPVDWFRLYVSRVLRLVPIYWFAIGVVFLIVACLSGFRLREPPYVLARKVLSWMSFTVLGAPDLNGVLHTKRIIWSVIWTLRYEWLFYLSLPLMSLCLRAAVSARYVVLSIVLVAGFVVCGVREVRWLAAFGGGIAASFVVRSEGFRLLAKTRVASAIVLGCLGSTFCFLPTGFSRATLLVLTIAFSLIAGGSTMFGVFVWPASRMLGAMCYSMYLLHGLLLYSVFQLGLGLERAGRLSPVQHWLVVCACVPVLVALCFMTFRLIEAPGMRSAGPVAAKLRDFMRRWRTAFGSRPVRRVNVSGTKLSAQPVAVALSAADGADAARTTGDPVL